MGYILISEAIATDDPEILDLIVKEFNHGSYKAKFRDVAYSQTGFGSVVTAQYSALGWAIKYKKATVAFHLVSRDKDALLSSCKNLAIENGLFGIANAIDEFSQRQPNEP